MNYERIFLENVGTIDQVVRVIARRHHLSPDESEELQSAVRLKILENGYEVLRRFEQRASLRTYLLVVVERFFLDGRMARWGKWRPCREARRAGPVAVLLDRLLTRDGLSFDEACEVLQTNHRVGETRKALYTMSLGFPDRTGRHFLGEEQLAEIPSVHPTPETSLDAAAMESARVEDALRAALASLGTQDRLLLKMHFNDGLSFAEISRVLSLDQKPLYRRIDHVKKVMRAELEARGVAGDRVLAMLGHPSVDLAPVISEGVTGNVAVGPSPRVTGTLTAPESGGRREG